MIIERQYFNHIYKIGKGKFDIREEKSRRYSEDSLRTKVKGLEPNEIISLLEYQLSNTAYPKVLLGIVLGKFQNQNYISNVEIRSIIKDWLKDKINIPSFDFSMGVKLIYPLNKPFAKFRQPMDEYLEFKKENETVGLLNLGLIILEEAILLHRMYCDQTDCMFEKNYNQKKNYINSKLNEISKPENEQKTITFDKIEWLGTQKELAELFIELKKNEWIKEFKYSAIKACFTKSKTIHQVLKPITDPKTKEETFEIVYTTKYDPKFYGIKPKITN